MSKLLIPLYYRPVNLDIGIPSNILLEPDPEEGAVLINADSLNALRPDLANHDTPRFHIFDTEAEARAAGLALSHEAGPLARFAQVGSLRDGEGVLMIADPDKPIKDDGFAIIDNRSGFCRNRTVFGSWELTGPDCDGIMGAPAGLNRPDLASAIAAKVGLLPTELVRDVQIAIERIPGAYVGFVSVSPEEIRRDFRLDGVDPARLPDALIQPHLDRASAKAELGDALNEAVDAAVERILDAHPDLTDLDSPEP
jgi:hypothetical protein